MTTTRATFALTLLLSLAMGGCLWGGKVAPPVAPCVYLVTALNSQGASAAYVNDAWYAERDIAVSGGTVTFTNCYSGQPVILHGSFSIQKLHP